MNLKISDAPRSRSTIRAVCSGQCADTMTDRPIADVTEAMTESMSTTESITESVTLMIGADGSRGWPQPPDSIDDRPSDRPMAIITESETLMATMATMTSRPIVRMTDRPTARWRWWPDDLTTTYRPEDAPPATLHLGQEWEMGTFPKVTVYKVCYYAMHSNIDDT